MYFAPKKKGNFFRGRGGPMTDDSVLVRFFYVVALLFFYSEWAQPHFNSDWVSFDGLQPRRCWSVKKTPSFRDTLQMARLGSK